MVGTTHGQQRRRIGTYSCATGTTTAEGRRHDCTCATQDPWRHDTQVLTIQLVQQLVPCEELEASRYTSIQVGIQRWR